AGGVLKNTKTFRISLHHAVFNSVVHHLHKVSRAGGPTIQVTVFGGTTQFFATRSSWNIAASRSQRLKDRVKLLHHFFRAAEHHAITTFQAPDPTARANVAVVNALVF